MSEMGRELDGYPWDRRDDEGGTAYYWFQEYLRMPPLERSLRRLARESIASGRRRGRWVNAYRIFGRWSSRYEWLHRAEAWDGEMMRRQREEEARRIVDMAAKHADVAAAHISLLSRAALALLSRFRDDPRAIDAMTDAQLYALAFGAARVIPQLADLERRSRGAPPAPADAAAPDVMGDDGMIDHERFLEVLAALEEAGYTAPFRELPPGEDDEDE